MATNAATVGYWAMKQIPALLGRTDQHLLEGAAPDDRPPEARENRLALPPVSRKGLSRCGAKPVRIGRLRAQFDQIEHMDWTGPVVGAKGGEGLRSGVDGAGHATSFQRAIRRTGAKPTRPTTTRVNAKRKRAWFSE